jgi:phosphate/sulfate permease
MLKILSEKLKESFASVLPVTLIVLVLSFTPLVSFSMKELLVFVVCAVFLVVGIGLFNLGADLAMTPMGEHVGSGLTKSRKLLLLLSVCFVMGVLITVAEPDLSVLAEQVKNAVAPMLLMQMQVLITQCRVSPEI